MNDDERIIRLLEGEVPDPERPADTIGSKDIEVSRQFAREVIAQTKHNPSQVGDMARCYLATLEDLEAVESELQALKTEKLTPTKEPTS